jgi:hypothetical protein
MKHVNLDAQNESVKQFVRDLSSDSGVSVLELNGEPVICVLPMTGPTNSLISPVDWTEEQNARRCQLIDNEIAGLLSADEVAELEDLQSAMLRHRRRIAPLPLEEARALHQHLLNRFSPPSQSTS